MIGTEPEKEPRSVPMSAHIRISIVGFLMSALSFPLYGLEVMAFSSKPTLKEFLLIWMVCLFSSACYSVFLDMRRAVLRVVVGVSLGATLVGLWSGLVVAYPGGWLMPLTGISFAQAMYLGWVTGTLLRD